MTQFAVNDVLRFKSSSVERLIIGARPTGYDTLNSVGPPLGRTDDCVDNLLLDGWRKVGVECRADWEHRNFGTRAAAVVGENVDGGYAPVTIDTVQQKVREFWGKLGDGKLPMLDGRTVDRDEAIQRLRQTSEDAIAARAKRATQRMRPVGVSIEPLSEPNYQGPMEFMSKMSDLAGNVLVGAVRRECQIAQVPVHPQVSSIGRYEIDVAKLPHDFVASGSMLVTLREKLKKGDPVLYSQGRDSLIKAGFVDWRAYDMLLLDNGAIIGLGAIKHVKSKEWSPGFNRMSPADEDMIAYLDQERAKRTKR